MKKKQSQAAKNGSRNAAVSQPQNTPNTVRTSPDDRAGEVRFVGTVDVKYSTGDPFAKFSLSDDDIIHCIRAADSWRQALPKTCQYSFPEFIRKAIRNEANRQLSKSPLTEFEDVVAQAAALIHVLASRCGELEELRCGQDRGKQISFGEFHLANATVDRLFASYESVHAYAVGLPSEPKGGAR